MLFQSPGIKSIEIEHRQIASVKEKPHLNPPTYTHIQTIPLPPLLLHRALRSLNTTCHSAGLILHPSTNILMSLRHTLPQGNYINKIHLHNITFHGFTLECTYCAQTCCSLKIFFIVLMVDGWI